MWLCTWHRQKKVSTFHWSFDSTFSCFNGPLKGEAMKWSRKISISPKRFDRCWNLQKHTWSRFVFVSSITLHSKSAQKRGEVFNRNFRSNNNRFEIALSFIRKSFNVVLILHKVWKKVVEIKLVRFRLHWEYRSQSSRHHHSSTAFHGCFQQIL